MDNMTLLPLRDGRKTFASQTGFRFNRVTSREIYFAKYTDHLYVIIQNDNIEIHPVWHINNKELNLIEYIYTLLFYFFHRKRHQE
jgi:hypothetical protein